MHRARHTLALRSDESIWSVLADCYRNYELIASENPPYGAFHRRHLKINISLSKAQKIILGEN
jgi:hypothetical protein